MKKENRGLWILVIVLGIIMVLLMIAIVCALIYKSGAGETACINNMACRMLHFARGA